MARDTVDFEKKLNESVNIDYKLHVDRFFNKLEAQLDAVPNNDLTEKQRERINEFKGEIRRLGNPKTLETMQKNTHLVAESLLFLISTATLSSDKEEETTARALFAETGKRLYPKAQKARIETAPESVKNLIERTPAVEKIEAAQLRDKLTVLLSISEDESTFINQTDQVITAMTACAEQINADDHELDKKEQLLMNEWVQMIYRMELLKQEIIKQQRQEKEESEAMTRNTTRSTLNEASRKRDEEMTRELKDRIFIEQILEQGTPSLYSSLPSELSPKHTAGFQTVPDQARNPSILIEEPARLARGKIRSLESIVGGYDVQGVFEKLGINEFATFQPIQNDIYSETVTKRFLRSDTVERIKVGEKTVTHSATVTGGKDEPAYQFIYLAADGHQPSYRYLDYSNRGGQYLVVDAVLPESTAKALAEKLASNPAFVRKLVEAIVIKKKQIPEKTWTNGEQNNGHPLRPPYEAWAADHGGNSRMLIDDPWQETIVATAQTPEQRKKEIESKIATVVTK